MTEWDIKLYIVKHWREMEWDAEGLTFPKDWPEPVREYILSGEFFKHIEPFVFDKAAAALAPGIIEMLETMLEDES